MTNQPTPSPINPAEYAKREAKATEYAESLRAEREATSVPVETLADELGITVDEIDDAVTAGVVLFLHCNFANVYDETRGGMVDTLVSLTPEGAEQLRTHFVRR